MAIYTLFRRWRTGTLALIEAACPGQAIERVAEARISLAYADLKRLEAPGRFLSGVDFRGADLSTANLSGSILSRADFRTASLAAADLSGARLEQADLRRADLRKADLRQADLRDVDFLGADLTDACLTGARLDGARFDWRWSAFVVELLRRDAGCRGDALRLVVEIAFRADDRPYAWLELVARKPALVDWVVSVVGRAVRRGDNAPEALRRLTSDCSDIHHTPTITVCTPASGSFYWTRSMHARNVHRPSAS